MKTLTIKMTIATAALLVAAGAASAQALTAEIPFAFRAGTANLTPGSYRLIDSHTTGVHHLVMTELVSGRSIQVIAPAAIPQRSDPSYGEAKLVFRCTGPDCSLKTVYMGTAGGVLDVPTWSSRDKELSAIRVISVRLK